MMVFPSRPNCPVLAFIHATLWAAIMPAAHTGMDVSMDLPEEYCHFETFDASCANDEVVVIERALYGRMRMGRCVKTDFGFMGCYVNVLDILDRKCSGRHRCTFDVVDPNFQGLRPCNNELKSYLEVTFRCIKLPSLLEDSCEVPATNSGFIPNILVDETLCGTQAFPWRLSTQKGQKLHITLIDFAVGQVSPGQPVYDNTVPEADVCYRKYGIISEPKLRKITDICGGLIRERDLYVSDTSTVELQFEAPESTYFLLNFKVIGCPAMTSAGEMLVKQQNEKMVEIGCKQSSQVWHLKCQGNKWEGKQGNCTNKGGLQQSHSNGGRSREAPPISSAITVGVVIGVACVISGAVVLGGILCAKRLLRKKRQPHKEEIKMTSGPLDCDRCERPLVEGQCTDSTCAHIRHQIYCTIRNDYSYLHALEGEPCYCARTCACPTPRDSVDNYGSTFNEDNPYGQQAELLLYSQCKKREVDCSAEEREANAKNLLTSFKNDTGLG